MAFPTFATTYVKSALGVGVQILTDPSVLLSLPMGSDGRPADVGLFGYGGIRGNTVAIDTTIAPILGVSSSDPTTALRAAERHKIQKLNKRVEKLDVSLQVPLDEAEQVRSRAKDAAAKEIRVAVVHAEAAHAENPAKAVTKSDSAKAAVWREKREFTSGSDASNRAGAKPRAAIKERKLLRAFGMMRRPNKKRIKPPPVLNGSEYRGFKRREVAKLKTYLDSRYEGGVEDNTVVQLVD
eukprot:jgi/Tetstr1/443743/TSEL_031731.t1